MVYILLEDGPTRKHGLWLPWGLGAYACVVTYLCAFTRGRVEFYVFQFGFGALELFCMGRVYLLQRQSADARVHRLFRLGFSAYVLGIAGWFVDLKLCDVVSITLPRYGLVNPQLHAVWHLLVSYGFYSLLVLVAQEAGRARPPTPHVPWAPARVGLQSGER
jgi:dihydroceramidase